MYYNAPSFEQFSSQDNNFFVATTVSRMLFSLLSSMAAPQYTLQRLSTPSLALGPHKNLMTARESEFQIVQKKIISIWDSMISKCLCFFCSNILKLMNAFNYPENNITESNYNEVLTHLNQTNPDIIQELQLQTCDMQVLLSQVSRYHLNILPLLLIDNNLASISLSDKWVNGWNNWCLIHLGSRGNRSGLHRVHRSNHQDAYFSPLGCPFLCHALLPRPLDYVWQHWGSGGSFAGPQTVAPNLAQRSFLW